MIRVVYIGLVFVLLSLSASAGKLEKAYEALHIYNYFKAKELFEKSYKKDTTGAGYGLSIIYLSKDNPFHQPDSAYKFILEAEKAFTNLDEKKRAKLFAVGVDSMEIREQKEKVSELFFEKAKAENTSVAYNSYLESHPWFKKTHQAIALRDKAAFKEANAKIETPAITLCTNICNGNVGLCQKSRPFACANKNAV